MPRGDDKGQTKMYKNPARHGFDHDHYQYIGFPCLSHNFDCAHFTH